MNNFKKLKIKELGMFNTLRQRQSSLGLSRISPVLLKLCSDSAIVRNELKLKALAEDDIRSVKKKEFHGHLIEKLFINKFKEEVLEYPQLGSLEEVKLIKRQYDVAQKLIADKTDDENALSEIDSKTAVATLKRHELTGFKIPRVKKGFGHLSSEYTYIQEVLGLDPSLSKTVSEQEDFGIYLIDKFGSDLQKEKYLMKLASGENIACLANIEKETLVSLVPDSFKTSAELSPDKQSYIITGTKSWVYNANTADLFILSANVSNEEKETKPTLFLVDKSTPGIEIHDPIETIGLKNLSICDVTFKNVVIPTSSILGDLHKGDKIIRNALSQGKLSHGGHCLAIMRKLLNNAIRHCIHNDFYNKDKHEVDYFRTKIAEMTSRMYAVESMTYLLTGRVDTHKDPDVFLESLIVKIHASETLQFIIKGALEILGPEFFTSDDNLIQLVKDSQFYVACDDPNDYLRVILAYSGLAYAIKYPKERTIFQLLSDVFSEETFRRVVFRKSAVSMKNRAKGYLHKMFTSESFMFEEAVQKLQESTKHVIKKYKDQAFNKTTELRYLADMVISAYAMAATLGRASRAYCIGVKLQELDRICTEIELRRNCFRIQEMHYLIQNPRKRPQVEEIAEAVMNSKQYSNLCPLVRSLTVQKKIH